MAKIYPEQDRANYYFVEGYHIPNAENTQYLFADFNRLTYSDAFTLSCAMMKELNEELLRFTLVTGEELQEFLTFVTIIVIEK